MAYERRKRQAGAKPRSAKRMYLLRGLVYCSCGVVPFEESSEVLDALPQPGALLVRCPWHRGTEALAQLLDAAEAKALEAVDVVD
jgi:hypothetical protein